MVLSKCIHTVYSKLPAIPPTFPILSHYWWLLRTNIPYSVSRLLTFKTLYAGESLHLPLCTLSHLMSSDFMHIVTDDRISFYITPSQFSVGYTWFSVNFQVKYYLFAFHFLGIWGKLDRSTDCAVLHCTLD